MAALSPLAQRIVALALLVLAMLLLMSLLVMPLLGAIDDSLAALANARARAGRLEAIASRPPPPPARQLPPTLYIAAATTVGAFAGAGAAVRAAAARAALGGVIVSAAPPGPGSGARHQVALHVQAAGADVGVMRFLNEVERGEPVIRFRSWQLAGVAGQPHQLRFDGIALATWGQAR